MRYKIIFCIALAVLADLKVISQSYRYFKDFDYASMTGKMPLPDENALPNFYLKCSYDKSGTLVAIATTTKLSWEAYHSTIESKVNVQKDRAFLLLGAGKRRDGYTRMIFQKKIFYSDTALVIHDTIIYKTTSDKNIRIQSYTNIGGDSIFFREESFTFETNKSLKISVLSNFDFYKDWFSLDSKAYYIVGGTIKLKSDTILNAEIIRSESYSNRRAITKSTFDDHPGMPLSFFWIKFSGALY